MSGRPDGDYDPLQKRFYGSNKDKQADTRERITSKPDNLRGVTITSSNEDTGRKIKGRKMRWDLRGED